MHPRPAQEAALICPAVILSIEAISFVRLNALCLSCSLIKILFLVIPTEQNSRPFEKGSRYIISPVYNPALMTANNYDMVLIDRNGWHYGIVDKSGAAEMDRQLTGSSRSLIECEVIVKKTAWHWKHWKICSEGVIIWREAESYLMWELNKKMDIKMHLFPA